MIRSIVVEVKFGLFYQVDESLWDTAREIAFVGDNTVNTYPGKFGRITHHQDGTIEFEFTANGGGEFTVRASPYCILVNGHNDRIEKVTTIKKSGLNADEWIKKQEENGSTRDN